MDPILVDLERRCIHRDGERHVLTAFEATLLGYLLANAGRNVSRRELLDDVWQQETGLETRVVDNFMGKLRKKLDRDPKAPVHLMTVRGLGYRLDRADELQVVGASRPEPARDAFPHAPDVDPETLVGRTEIVRRVTGLLTGGARLVTLHGVGGVGKTRVALEVVRQLRAAGRTVIFLDLSACTSQGEAAARLAGAVGPTDLDLSACLERIVAVRAVLVLDNLEQLLGVGPSLMAPILAVQGVQVLATSRATVGDTAEHVVPIPPLDPDSALELLTIRCRRFDPDWGVEGVDRDAVQELIAVVDRLPLALELVASRLRFVSPHEAALALVSTPTTEGVRPADRHRGVTSAIQWSWNLLGEQERQAMTSLTLFRAPFSLEAAGLVVGGTGPESKVLALADKSLVARAEGSRGRMKLLMLVRRFVEGIAPPDDQARARHVDAFLRLAQKPDAFAEGIGVALEAAEDLHEAVRSAHGQGRGDDAVRLFELYTEVVRRRGPVPRGRALFALLSSGAGVRVRRAWAAVLVEFVLHDELVALYDDPTHASLDDRERGQLATALARTGRSDDARKVLAGAIDASSAAILGAHASIAGGEGDVKGALAFAEAAVEGARRAGDREATARALIRAGGFRRNDGNFAGERAAHLEALETFRALHLPLAEATSVTMLGVLDAIQGNLDAAKDAYTEAIALYRRSGDIAREGQACTHLGNVEARRKNWDEAEGWLREGERLGRAARDYENAALACENLGVLYDETARYREARAVLLESVHLSGTMGNVVGRAWAEVTLAVVEARLGVGDPKARLDQAAATLSQNLMAQVEIGLRRIQLDLMADDAIEARRHWEETGAAIRSLSLPATNELSLQWEALRAVVGGEKRDPKERAPNVQRP